MSLIPTSPQAASRFDPEDLVGRIRRGDPLAHAEFANQFQPGLRALFRARFSEDLDLADDLAQECLLTAWEQILDGQLRKSAALAGYVRTIAWRLIVRAGERKAADRHRYSGVGVDELSDDFPEQWYAVYRDELRARILTWLKSLALRDRELLWAHFFTDDSKGTVARTFGVTESHYDVLIFRAKKRLRAIVEASADVL